MNWLLYFVFSFCMLRLFIFATDYKWAFPAYSLGALIIIAFWTIYIFKKTRWNDFINKIALFNISFYHIIIIIFFIIVQYNRLTTYSAEELFKNWGKTISITASSGISDLIFYCELSVVPILIVLNYILLKKIIRYIYFESDPVNDEHIFVGMFKPRGYISILMSIFKLTPVSGVFLYANNCVYAFKRTQDTLQKLSSRVLIHDYILINTGILIENKKIELENLVGQKWSFLNNCLTVFKPVLGKDIFEIISRRASNGKGKSTF